MNNQKLEDVKFHKHLGVTISDDGSLNKHIELVIDKAYSKLNILRMLKFMLDRSSLWFSRLFFSFIYPVSLYNSLKEVNFVPPDMILIASI
jgi:hypothetical protein